MIESAMAFQTGERDADFAAWSGAVKKTMMRQDPLGRTAGPIPTFDKSFGAAMREALLSNQEQAHTAQAFNAAPATSTHKDDNYTFGDVIDMINPLQHIPVVGSIYRSLTGDSIKGMSAIIGGAIFGGPIGAVAGTVNVIAKDRTGKDIGENIMSAAGFGTPYTSPVPEITYKSAAATSLSGDTLLASANYQNASDGRKNFAAAAKYTGKWNS